MGKVSLHITLSNKHGQLLLNLVFNAHNWRDMVRKLATLLFSRSFNQLFSRGSCLSVTDVNSETPPPEPVLPLLQRPEVLARLRRCAKDEKDILLVRHMHEGKSCRMAAVGCNMSYDTAKDRLSDMYELAFGYYNNSLKGKKFDVFIHYLSTGECRRTVPIPRLNT